MQYQQQYRRALSRDEKRGCLQTMKQGCEGLITYVPEVNAYLAQGISFNSEAIDIAYTHCICNCISWVGEGIQYTDLGFNSEMRGWWRDLRNSVVHDHWKPGFDKKLDNLIRGRLSTPDVWSNLATHATDLIAIINLKSESL